MNAKSNKAAVQPTTPASTPMDTLKALALRNIDQLEFVIDQLGDQTGIPEWLVDYIDGIRLSQYTALSEHMPVGVDERLGEPRHLPDEAFKYDDGTPVAMVFRHELVNSVFYPRYDDEAKVRESHLKCVAEHEQRTGVRDQFDNIVRGIDWGRNGPMDA